MGIGWCWHTCTVNLNRIGFLTSSTNVTKPFLGGVGSHQSSASLPKEVASNFTTKSTNSSLVGVGTGIGVEVCDVCEASANGAVWFGVVDVVEVGADCGSVEEWADVDLMVSSDLIRSLCSWVIWHTWQDRMWTWFKKLQLAQFHIDVETVIYIHHHHHRNLSYRWVLSMNDRQYIQTNLLHQLRLQQQRNVNQNPNKQTNQHTNKIHELEFTTSIHEF